MARKVFAFVFCVFGYLGIDNPTSAQEVDLFAVPVEPAIALEVEDTAVPVPQLPPFGKPGVDKVSQQIQRNSRRIRQLQMSLREAEDDRERDKVANEIEKLVSQSFDLETKRIQNRLAKMKEELAQRSKDRASMIEKRIASLLDPRAMAPGPGNAGGKPYLVESVKKQKDGSSIAKVRMVRTEQRTREVPYTVQIPQTRTRVVNGKEQTYTVMVAETRSRTETYQVTIPLGKLHTVTIPKGKDKDEVLSAFAKKTMRR